MKSTQRNLRAGTLAVLVSACMLLCVLSPAIINLDGEGAFADGGSEPSTFNYVAVGDSMTNGFGHTGYYPVGDNPAVYVGNHSGLLKDVETTFPHMLAAELEKRFDADGSNRSVNYVPLGMSSMRSSEFRSLLDNSFVGDEFNQEWRAGGNEFKNSWGALEESYRSFEGVSKFYKENISTADLITYNFHYDFGYTLTQDIIMPFIETGEMTLPDFSVYLSEEQLEYYGLLVEILMAYIDSVVADLGIGDMMEFVKGIAAGIAYCIIAYCTNFDENMRLIFELNDDVDIIVIDSYNSFKGMVMTVGDSIVPLGDIYGYALDIANSYVTYVSPYATSVYHTTVDGYPYLFSDKFRDVNDDGATLSNDDKNTFIDTLYSTIEETPEVPDYPGVPLHYNYYYQIYDAINENGNLSKFLGYVFSTTELDWEFFIGGNIEDETAAIAEAVTKLFPSENSHGLLATGEVVFNPEDGSITVKDTNDEVSLTKGQVSLLWMNFFVMEAGAVMSHPSAEGHEDIFNDILTGTEEATLDEATLCREVSDVLVGIPSFIVFIESNPGIMEENEGHIALVTEIHEFLAYVKEDPLSAFLNLSRESGMELLGSLIDNTNKMYLSLHAEMVKNPGVIPDDVVEDAYKTANAIVMVLNKVKAIAEDYSVYEGDELRINFDPSEPYKSVYIGSVFSAFEDPDNCDLDRTLYDIVSTIDMGSLMDADLIHVATNSGNIQFIVNGLFESQDPLDYSDYADLIGEENASFFNSVRDRLAPIVEQILVKYLGDDIISDIATDLLDRIAYVYVGSLIAVEHIVSTVTEGNPDASILLYGTYNEFRGVDIKIGDAESIPFGDIIDKLYAVYDILIYELCEEYDNVAFADVSDATTPLSGTVINGATVPALVLSLIGCMVEDSNMIPDKQVFVDAAAKWIVNDNVILDISWVLPDETVVTHVKYGDMPEFPGTVVAPQGYEFKGWDKQVVKAQHDATYTAVFGLEIEEKWKDNVEVDVSVLNTVDIALIEMDDWTVEVPTAIFDGLSGKATITVKALDVEDVPSALRSLAGSHKVMLLEMSVGGDTISSFGDNTVKVSFAYEPEEGMDVSKLSVYWFDEKAWDIIEYPATFDADTGMITFDTSHFSYWYVDQSSEPKDGSNGGFPIVIVVVIIAILAGLCVLFLRMKR